MGVTRSLSTRALRLERPPLWLGAATAAVAVALATAAISPLESIAPTVSLSVVYLPAVVLVSVYWGLLLGLATSLASAATFNFFHIPPVGRFTISDPRNWVALATFMLVSLVISALAELARNRALEAERRRGEADLAANLARELLGSGDTRTALSATARRVSDALGVSSASIELDVVEDSGRMGEPLRARDGHQIATLLLPPDLTADALERVREHVVPTLEALVGIALHRDAAQAEAVETAALRRSDELKTALLRSVSHDLRTPVTAIVAAGHALGAASLSDEDRGELSAAVVEEGERLSALINKLLDLSRLQAGRAESQRDWVSIEEVLLAARDSLPAKAGELRLFLDDAVPPVRADAAQLGRVFSNLLENAWRYSGGLPVSVHVRRGPGRVIVRIVDQGPGISRFEQQRIFEPFYRGSQSSSQRWHGSGLGLAIAKGFVEANGGTVVVESLPGQGTSFVVELPVSEEKVAA